MKNFEIIEQYLGVSQGLPNMHIIEQITWYKGNAGMEHLLSEAHM